MAAVLVIGASRGIGLETVKQALARGHKVRAMARSAQEIRIDHPNLEPFAGDALNAADVSRALRGIETVVQTLGVKASSSALFKPTRLFSEATRILLAEMEKAGVRRLICLTGFGAGDSRHKGSMFYNAAFELLLSRVYNDKDVQEMMIRRSNLDWVIARPGILTNGPKTGEYRVLADPREWRSGIISRADVADFLVNQIDSDKYLHTTPALIR